MLGISHNRSVHEQNMGIMDDLGAFIHEQLRQVLVAIIHLDE